MILNSHVLSMPKDGDLDKYIQKFKKKVELFVHVKEIIPAFNETILELKEDTAI